MSVKINSLSLSGLNVKPVRVEIDLDPGLHSFKIVGLPDKAVEEARERVGAAIKSSGAKAPQKFNRKIIINLAPADLKKQGPAFDLPIAIAFLSVSEQIKFSSADKLIFAGELSLDGSLRTVQGILPMTIFAREKDMILVIPEENRLEANLIRGAKIISANSLKELIKKLENNFSEAVMVGQGINETVSGTIINSDFDVGFIKGQEQAKRALEIAASGGHHVLLSGSPGSGKTILARTMPTIMPRMTEEETIEVTKIWSVAGLLHSEHPLMTERPFRAPHHSASVVSIVGGGTYPKPGEISLAHRGVLFMDEFPEFQRPIVEALRQPLEDGEVTVARAKETILFPARFSLVAAQNPCPCGNLNDKEIPCVCSSGDIMRYARKISGPILDRIDIAVFLSRIPFKQLRDEGGESSAQIQKRVEAARAIQKQRFASLNINTNAEMSSKQVSNFCGIDEKGTRLLETAHNKFHLSPRGVNRILKVARTIADLAEEKEISPVHIAEAIQYRQKDNN